MLGVLLPELFPSFDDKIQDIQPILQTILSEETKEFPLTDVLELGIPLVYSPQPEDLYSPQQRRLQKLVEKAVKFNLTPLPKPVILAGVSLAAVAYSTGSMGIAASSPEIQSYDESAFGSGVGSYTII
jgi:hypothetical protein